ncbi:MAG: 50S ribosomal protein L18 [Candidatus Diapherotrites archaeon]|uniref:Large ribosomal subunit protein uL18 n=1 Tax=Candidatus Iainarchaeum sp. TaxID=3101447 RepID=A0A2D6LPB5_9ARCH|nr:50S ribosomal protein L18 [Candidatus Diapherotrites archaeon]|tara:strand:+ start:5216 stop:5725 length:510 start_codon:yes stop_codon:yes gene_type:complete
MSSGPTYNVKFRRRRESKTNYKKRLGLLKSNKDRLVVRKSNNSTVCEIVTYKTEGDKVRAHFTTSSLKKLGWKGHTGNIPAAYLTGYACAKKAMKDKVGEAVLDLGLVTPVHGGRIFGALKGAIDAGLTMPSDEKVFPKDGRISGKHISEDVEKNFEETKKNIDKELGE